MTGERDRVTGSIHTWTSFAVIEWIAGEPDRTRYALRTLGGEVDGESVRVAGMPQFEVGAEYVVFVREGARFICPLVGWHQGCFRVDRETAAHEPAPRLSAKSSAVIRDYYHQEILGVRDGRLLRSSPKDEPNGPGDIPIAGGTGSEVRPLTPAAFIAEIRSIRARTDAARRSGSEP
ncbi:MAG: hypothetical protein HOP29_05050 [Phycisphaerales bacterium]|nr:hypothetical protein [Phycisphaerales bacterium]